MTEFSSIISVNKIINSGKIPPKTVSDYWQMVYIEKGIADITINNHIYRVEGEMLIFIAPNEFVHINSNEKLDIFSAFFEVSGEVGLTSAHKIIKATPKEMFLLEELKEITDKSDILDFQKANTLLQLLMLICLKKEAMSPLSNKRDAAIFSKSADILHQNISSQISVSELSEKLNISLSHLKRIFSHYTAIGVHEYHLLLKVKKAKELLSQGESVTATAAFTGFSNQAYFSAAFKRITGVSPKIFSIKRPSDRPDSKSNTKSKDLPSYLL